MMEQAERSYEPEIIVTEKSKNPSNKKGNLALHDRCPHFGLIRWATNEADLKKPFSCFVEENHYDSPYLVHGVKEKLTWKNATIFGVMTYFEHPYVVSFSPLMNLITWRIMEEKDCEKFKIPKEQFLGLGKPETDYLYDSGYIQNEFIARIFDQLFKMTIVTNSQIANKAKDNKQLEAYYKGYKMIKGYKIIKCVCNNLTWENKMDIDAFVSVLAAIDGKEWKSEIKEHDGLVKVKQEKIITMIGTPNHGGCIYKYYIIRKTDDGNEEWIVNGRTNYHWPARNTLSSIIELRKRYDMIIVKIRKDK
jgi:hypothetical protein